jgi:hypothetical protein
MEKPDASQYTDHETVAREWSVKKIYQSLVMRTEGEEGPMIAAAGLQSSSVLRFLLERTQLLEDEETRSAVLNQATDPYIGGTNKWTTPLLRAIERQRPENVRLLLAHGADPNGCCIQTQRNLSRLVRRFWLVEASDLEERYPDELPFALSYGAPIRTTDVGKVSEELAPLTDAEIKNRRTRFFPRFWTERHKKGLDYSRDDTLLNSIVRAGTSSPEILDLLLDGGADAQFWQQPDTNEQLKDEEHLSPSALALSTPLHAAIAGNNLTMLRVLLQRGFNPNARAIITGSLAITPAQYAITTGRLEAYSILKTHDQLDAGIVTPIYRAHILHFATALLRLELMRATELPLSTAPPTALGHTLLHVACMPYNGADVQASPKIEKSINDVRNMRDTRYILHPTDSAMYDASGVKIRLPQEGQSKSPQNSPRDIPNELQQQEGVCRHIISELGATHIGLTDVHGNTALHYLAGAWFLNEGLISWMREQIGGEDVWTSAENIWGHTPLALWEENQAKRAKALTAVQMRDEERGGRPGGRGRGRGRGRGGLTRNLRRRGLG